MILITSIDYRTSHKLFLRLDIVMSASAEISPLSLVLKMATCKERLGCIYGLFLVDKSFSHSFLHEWALSDVTLVFQRLLNAAVFTRCNIVTLSIE